MDRLCRPRDHRLCGARDDLPGLDRGDGRDGTGRDDRLVLARPWTVARTAVSSPSACWLRSVAAETRIPRRLPGLRGWRPFPAPGDRKRLVWGQSVSVRVI